MASETSSHFLVPAIHKNRTQIRDLFREHLGLENLTDDPADLAEAAGSTFAEVLTAEVAVSGANFAFADTRTVGVVSRRETAECVSPSPGPYHPHGD